MKVQLSLFRSQSKLYFRWVKYRLGTLPFSLGLWVLAVSAVFYFAALGVGIFVEGGIGKKGTVIFILWMIGRTLRYLSFAIIGVRGWQRLKSFFQRWKKKCS